jgi:hypothetical protein
MSTPDSEFEWILFSRSSASRAIVNSSLWLIATRGYIADIFELEDAGTTD